MKVEKALAQFPVRGVLAVLFFVITFSTNSSTIAQTQSYEWRSVIDGGGGFVPGIIYSQFFKGIVYARTDMGGAYRWSDSLKQWIPLTDMMDRNNSDYMGILSIAPDPNDSNRVYMECGKYTQSWAGNGALLVSTDKGNSWEINKLSFKVGGNEDGRGCGERLQMDPNADSILIMGTSSIPQTSPGQAALWKSTDYGKSWNAVSSFTASSVNFVIIDPASGSQGTPSQRLFVAAVNTSGQSLYESTDGGASWNAVAGQPSGVMAIRGALADTTLYLTFANYQGPNGATSGSVWKFGVTSGAWTNISPSSGSYGFSGLSVYPPNPKIAIVSTLDRWSPMDEVYLTTDGGSTWQGRLVGSTLDHSYAPYTSSVNPHWLASLSMDPLDSSKAMFGTGFGIWACDDIFAAKPTWYFKDENLEETVPMQLIAPPFTKVMSAMGDYDGFRNDQLDESPRQGRYHPAKGTTLSIAFAQNVPSTIVKAYNASPYGAYSTDGGTTWRDFSKRPSGATAGGTWTIAVSADGRNIVWEPTGSALSYSTDFGKTWSTCGGGVPTIPAVTLCADKADPGRFYAYDGTQGKLYLSTDSGRTFSRMGNIFPSVPGYQLQDASVTPTPGRAGDIWLCTGSGGLLHSTNSGSTRSKVSAVTAAYLFGTGKSATPGSYPTLYLWGIANGTLGIFRSTDSAATWIRINDDSHQYGYLHQITGDPRVFGRCYISAEGRGVLYGEPLVSDTAGVPTTFMFNSAPSDSIVHYYQKISVSWTRAVDPKSKPLTYVLHFFGPGVDTIFSTTDSSATFSVGKVEKSAYYTLAGRVTNGTDTSATSNSITVLTASTLTGVVRESSVLPERFGLSQNFPNPFNPSTTISYQLPVSSRVTLYVYNVLGQRVFESSHGMEAPGYYREVIQMDKYASGVYFYRISASGTDGRNFISTMKMLMLK